MAGLALVRPLSPDQAFHMQMLRLSIQPMLDNIRHFGISD